MASKSKCENKLVKDWEKSLDESQKVLLKKLVDMHIKSCFDHSKGAFAAGARTAVKLVVETITDD